MSKENRWKEPVNSLKRSFETDQVFRENEVQANQLVLRSLVACLIILGCFWLLALSGVFNIDRSLISKFFLPASVSILLPAVACSLVKGRKHWVKYVMMAAIIIAAAFIDRVMTFNVPLLIIIPVVFSCRYYSGAFTVLTTMATSVAFFISSWIGALRVIGSPDMNFMADDPSEYLKNVMLQSFLPKWMLFLIVAGVCFEIARCGRNMVLNQDRITKFNTRVETELELANRIQAQALPPLGNLSDKTLQRLDLSARMIPAKEVGGDFYDFIELDDDHLALIIADVADKGIAAALYMMMAKSLLENRLMTTPSPAQVLEKVNGQLFDKKLKGMFVTVWLGILDLRSGELVMASAGHEYPALRRNPENGGATSDVVSGATLEGASDETSGATGTSDGTSEGDYPAGKFELLRDKHGFVLGGLKTMKYSESRITLNEGDILFVYTDGVPEANNLSQEQFGVDRMLNALDSHCSGTMNDMILQVKAEVDVFADKAPQFDDTTMLAVKILKLGAVPGSAPEDSGASVSSISEARLTLKPELPEIERAQQWLLRLEEQQNLPDKQRKKIAICVDELLNNIIQYSGAKTIEIEFVPSPKEITVVIRDDGKPFNPLELDEPDTSTPLTQRESGGLGVLITRKFMSRTAYSYENGRNVFAATLIRE